MKTLRWIPLLLLALLAGCVKNEVTVEFRLPSDYGTPCRMLYYASGKNQGMVRETVAEISEGRGVIKLPTRYPTIVYLFSPSQKDPVVAFYASRGDKMVVEGSSPEMKQWKVTGNEVSEEVSAWRVSNASAFGSPVALNKAVKAFVDKNPASKAALMILVLYYSRRDDEAGFRQLYSKIDRKVFEDTEFVNALGAADLLEGVAPAPAVPERLVLTGSDGYADTLAMKGTALLMFVDGNVAFAENPDSLRTLAANAGKGVVAELFMEADSITWRRHLRNDSVEGVKRLLMPMGIADPVAMKMGVRRVPWYVVVDRGKFVYNGPDRIEARKAFKRLVNK